MEKISGTVMPYNITGKEFNLSFVIKMDNFVAKKWDYIIVDKYPNYQRGNFEFGYSMTIKTGDRLTFYTDFGHYIVNILGYIGDDSSVNFIVANMDGKTVIFNIKSINAVVR